MRRARSVAVAALAAAAVVAGPRARGNGRFPTSQFVVVGPGEASDVIALRTTFGVLTSRDSGRSWQWLCEELFEYGSGQPWDPPVALGSRGADGVPLLVGLTDGLARATDGCRASRVPEVGDEFSGDLTASADGRRVYFVASNGGARPNRVFASEDGGRTFAPLGAGVGGVLFETLEVPDADPRRVYLTGVIPEPRRYTLHRSDDGGRTLRELPLDLRGGRDAFLAAVDPRDPDVVYVRSTLPGDGATPAGTLLLRSTDGGARFEELTRTAGPMLGFALSGDGRTIWVGGPAPDDRLRRSDDGGRTFRRVADTQVLCLRWHAGALYVCANHLADGFALGRSDDGGGTLVPLLRFQDLPGPPSCPSGTVGRDICAVRWPQVRRLLGVEAPDAGPRDAGMDGGARPAPGDGGAGCGCATAPASTARGWWLLALAALGYDRRRRAARPTSASAHASAGPRGDAPV